jgi:1-deoxy-D-xylulose-5-phosphate reductoisomerase
VARLDFQAPDLDRFPCLGLAYQAIASGGAAPAVLNAANEAAVSAFLDHRLGFTEIARVVGETLDTVPAAPVADLDMLLDLDARARRVAEQRIGALVE